MIDNENWRRKYRDVANELEICEKSRNVLIEQLHGFAVQLTLATHGQNPQLDRLMSDLTHDLGNSELKRVDKYLKQIDKQIRGLDGLRAKTAQQIMQQLRVWLKELQTRDSLRQFSDTFDLLNQQMLEHPEANHVLPEMLAQLLSVQRGLNSSPPSLSAELSEHDDLANARLAAGLLELVQRLSIPAEYISRASALIQRLEKSHSTTDLDECIKEATELARLSGSGTDADIQAYLSGLNEQLAFLREFFDTQEEVEMQQRKRNNLLDQTVRADVQVIHHKVQQSQDINELKKAVNVQLVSIIKAMNQHKVFEQKRIDTIQAEKKVLLERLNSMELQSQKLKKSAEDAHVKSRTDPLTGLPNRLAYDQRFEEELARFNRYGTLFSLCVADIDYFKQVNDQYGHLAGDKVLRLMSRILKQQLRTVDFIARFGGEEFVIIMPSTDAQAAKTAMDKVRGVIETSPFNFHSKPVKITMSFGITQVQVDDSLSSVFARADQAMYRAKQEGRNGVCVE